MHTFWVRLNAVVFFGFTVLLCLSLLTAIRYARLASRQVCRNRLTHTRRLTALFDHSTIGHRDYGTVHQLNINKLIQLCVRASSIYFWRGRGCIHLSLSYYMACKDLAASFYQF